MIVLADAVPLARIEHELGWLAAILEAAEELLGLADRLVDVTTAKASIWTRGALHPMPRTVMGIPAEPVDFATIERHSVPLPSDDISVAAYVTERAGVEVLDRLVEPLLGGVYAGHADALSLAAAGPQLLALGADPIAAAEATEPAPGPVFVGLRGGVGQLTAALAESLGWTTLRPDYREDDALGYAGSVPARLARLRAAIEAQPAPPMLVGSSMGAFVSGLASLEHPVAGLFLLATPESIPGCEVDFDVTPDVPTVLIHGWRDELCPLDDMYTFAARRQLPLLILDDDHRLSASVDTIVGQFRLFLDQLAARA